MPASRIPALFVLAGLIHGSTAAAPVPPQEVAEIQLRAINHRVVVDPGADLGSDLMQTLIHDDFLFTRRDGTWLDRAAFMGTPRGERLQGAVIEGLRVRLFGRVALAHGVFTAAGADGARQQPVRYTDVYLWSGSAWRLVSAQETPLRDGVAVVPITGIAPVHAPWRDSDPAADTAATLRTLNERYVKAFRDADVAWYDAHLAPDYAMVSGDGVELDRSATLARFAQPTFATSMKSFPVGRVTIRRFDDVALIHAENAYELKDGRTGVSRYTDIWHRQHGRWLCVAAHITVFRAPAH
jgi:ketosteroid isomerase-like protein